MELKNYVYNIPDYPEKGIVYKDITPICANSQAFEYTIDHLTRYAKKKKADLIVSPESRGFLFGAPVAADLGIGFIPARNPKKLPREVIKSRLGGKELAIHKDAIKPGMRVVIIDDMLASGTTILGTIDLVKRLGGIVSGVATVVEIKGLNGRKALEGYDYYNLTEDEIDG